MLVVNALFIEYRANSLHDRTAHLIVDPAARAVSASRKLPAVKLKTREANI
jgi:hypothetical protein